MSRIGKRLLKIPTGVDFKIDADFNVAIKGPLGVLKKHLSGLIAVNVQDGIITTNCPNQQHKKNREMWGTTNALLSNWIHGVTKGYQKELSIEGLGFKAKMNNNILELNLGFSHPIHYPLPADITVDVVKNTRLIIKGIDKAMVGLVASQIRKKHKPDVYKGKGVFYEGQKINLKVGKTATKK